MRLASVLLLTAISAVFAAPQGHPHALYVEGTAPGSASDDHHPSPMGLPGFDHLMRNKTVAVIDASDGAAFDGKCMQVTLGGHGKVGQTMLEGRCVDASGLWWETSINLNECFGNNAGQLVYREMGNFDGSCRPCTLDNAQKGVDLLLKCNCLDERKFPKYTYLELGFKVKNFLAVRPVDGRFICGNRLGIRSPAL